MITHSEYMKNSAELHHAFYMQFVNADVINLVKQKIGVDRIIQSNNSYFNDIPLHRWDALDSSCRVIMNRKNAIILKPLQNGSGFLWSLSDSICTMKAAARFIKEAQGV